MNVTCDQIIRKLLLRRKKKITSGNKEIFQMFYHDELKEAIPFFSFFCDIYLGCG